MSLAIGVVMSRLFIAALGLLVLLVVSRLEADAVARMTAAKLKGVHESIEANNAARQPVEQKTGYDDVRAILHCHSKWSHDSRSTIEEIIEGAHKAGVRVIMFTEHPADHYDFVTDGHQGLKDGVLLVPGAELHGMLAYPLKSLKGLTFSGPQEQSDMIKRTGGLAFICHLEERMDWEIPGITGTEMYNTHADAKEESRLFLGMVNPLFWLQLRPLIEQYPQELYGALLDYPKDYLKRYDELCQKFPHTGVAGDDSHHNIGMKIIRGEKDLIILEDLLGDKKAELSISKLPFLAPVAGKSKPGDVIMKLDLDPYDRSFHHVSTHLLMNGFDREHVWEALEAGRAYVAFDWLCDPTGFIFQAIKGEEKWPIGSKIKYQEGLKLFTIAPLEAKIRLIRNGELVQETKARELSFDVKEPGVYRVEYWLQVGDEERPWILSNPIYIRPAQ
jgi:hypothetical protein